MEKTIFEQIADGSLPSYTVWENETHMAFLSIGPVVEGHTLVIPKVNENEYIFGLNDEQYSTLLLHAKNVAKLLQEKLDVDRVLMYVEGFEVPHVHVHLLPVNQSLGFMAGKVKEMSEKEFTAIQQKITQ